MNDMENVYRELHHLVRHGQKQGFVAGITVSAIALAASKARQARRNRERILFARRTTD